MAPTLRELHELFRKEDALGRAGRRRAWDRRMAGNPAYRRECAEAIRCDADHAGLCRWCGRRCSDPAPRPRFPYGDNQGDVLKREAYDYHYGNDEADLPYWYWGAGREMAA